MSPQWSQVRPDVTNVPSRRSSNSHPHFIAHNGSDVEEELSESSSQAAAREQVEEMEETTRQVEETALPQVEVRQVEVRQVEVEETTVQTTVHDRP